MTYAHPEVLVSAEWLAQHLDDSDMRILDASYKMPGILPSAIEEYRAAHIPGAGFFDIDEIADHETSLPHMLPSPSAFARAVAALGISNRDRIIVYDAGGVMGAARAWWSLRVFGHDNVAVLDGGLLRWRQLGYPLIREVTSRVPGDFTAVYKPGLVRSRDQVLTAVETGGEQILDARNAARFRGEAGEPWPGRRAGRIPGSFNLDHTALVSGLNKTFLPAARLNEIVAQSGIDPHQPVVTSCGSGITACVLALGLHLIGAPNVAVYDGSWAEWGLPGPLPIETGDRKN